MDNCQCYVRDGAHIKCRVCAAAPALLEALEALMNAPVYHSGVEHAAFDKAKAAIATAKGEHHG